MSRRLIPALPAAALLFACVALWLAVANPSIDDTSRGDSYTCLAPYDTVLNGADNVPGGEPPPDSDDIAARCTGAGEDRFVVAVGAAGAAALAVIGAAVVASRQPS